MAEFLLDTHALLYLLGDPPKISSELRAELETARLYVSAASTWEIAIKVGLSKLTIPKNFYEQLDELDLTELPVTIRHTREVLQLEKIHADPFDRILIAQARAEKLTIVTNDVSIQRYADVITRW